jgi:hypothetical protein
MRASAPIVVAPCLSKLGNEHGPRFDGGNSHYGQTLHVPRKIATFSIRAGQRGRVKKMASKAMRRSAAALAVAATVVGVGASGALAQDYAGSSVTTAGDTTGVEAGDILILAPGVTISGGEVSNETGIGVVIGGGSSVGSTAGGDTNTAADG